MQSTSEKVPYFAEDSDMISVSPNLAQAAEQLEGSTDKNDYLMAFIVTIMSEYGYRVSTGGTDEYA